MKLLLENWREYLEEDVDKRLKDSESPKLKRIREVVESKGYYLDKKLGSGVHGDVYLIEDKKTGQRLAMKVVTQALYGGSRISKREYQNYKFVMDNKASLPEEHAQFLPDVYEVVKGVKDYFIFMELLEPMPARVSAELFAAGTTEDLAYERDPQFYKRFFSNPETIYDIIKQAIKGSEMIVYTDDDWKIRGDESIPKIALKDFLANCRSQYTTAPTEQMSCLAQYIADAIVDSHPSLQDDYVDLMISLFNGISLNLVDDGQSVVPVNVGSPHYSRHAGLSKEITKNFPEVENLIKTMNYLYKNEKWRPKDIHSGNVMVRPKTKDFVITDLGLFEFV